MPTVYVPYRVFWDNIVPKSTASQCLNPTVNVTRSILNIEESADYQQPIDQASQD